MDFTSYQDPKIALIRDTYATHSVDDNSYTTYNMVASNSITYNKSKTLYGDILVDTLRKKFLNKSLKDLIIEGNIYNHYIMGSIIKCGNKLRNT